MADTITITDGWVKFARPYNVREALTKIAALLGEPTVMIGGNPHYDVGRLCLSAKINRYSLVRPTFSTAGTVDSDDLPTHTPVTENGYRSMGYGWRVPYAVEANASELLDAFKGKFWKHADPNLDDSSYAILTHFDGYYHSATPQTDWFQVTQCAAGKPIVCTFYQGKFTTNTADVPSLFFGYRMGVAVYTPNASVSFKGAYESKYKVGEPVTDDDGHISLPLRDRVECGTAESISTYTFVPYLRKDNENIYYSGNISEEFPCIVENMSAGVVKGASATLSFQDITASGVTNEKHLRVTLMVRNENPDYALKPMNVTVNYIENYGDNASGSLSFYVPRIPSGESVAVSQEMSFPMHASQLVTFSSIPQQWTTDNASALSGMFTIPSYTYNPITGTVDGGLVVNPDA